MNMIICEPLSLAAQITFFKVVEKSNLSSETIIKPAVKIINKCKVNIAMY